eukprot:2093401-Rhodomonas_salina.1
MTAHLRTRSSSALEAPWTPTATPSTLRRGTRCRPIRFPAIRFPAILRRPRTIVLPLRSIILCPRAIVPHLRAIVLPLRDTTLHLRAIVLRLRATALRLRAMTLCLRALAPVSLRLGPIAFRRARPRLLQLFALKRQRPFAGTVPLCWTG